jgi:hypothetical protein
VAALGDAVRCGVVEGGKRAGERATAGGTCAASSRDAARVRAGERERGPERERSGWRRGGGAEQQEKRERCCSGGAPAAAHTALRSAAGQQAQQAWPPAAAPSGVAWHSPVRAAMTRTPAVWAQAACLVPGRTPRAASSAAAARLVACGSVCRAPRPTRTDGLVHSPQKQRLCAARALSADSRQTRASPRLTAAPGKASVAHRRQRRDACGCGAGVRTSCERARVKGHRAHAASLRRRGRGLPCTLRIIVGVESRIPRHPHALRRIPSAAFRLQGPAAGPALRALQPFGASSWTGDPRAQPRRDYPALLCSCGWDELRLGPPWSFVNARSSAHAEG